MWLVRIALRRPYTFIVMALLIVVLGVFELGRMPTDIFPEVDIPVISVVWNYTGMQPDEMEKRIVNGFERSLTTTVNDVEHIESQTLTGISVVKIFFQPGAKIEAATAQVTAIAQTVVHWMPPGTVPPFIIQYSASNVPIMQIALRSDTLSEQQLFDYGTNFIRADLATVPGAQLPWPYGGKQRQIAIDIDPKKLYAWNLSPRDVSAALGSQNVIIPSGSAKIGNQEYPVSLNGSPELLEDLGNVPIKVVNGTPVYLHDVAGVRDGYAPQHSIVHVDGTRSVLLTVLKNGNSSTLDVASGVRKKLPASLARLPKELKASILFDQSLFVRAAVTGVVREAAIAAGLTALMLLVFLGSWRSTFIVVVSIPLSLLVAIVVLSFLHETLNVMTLGGMSLAVGILVDDATVELENVHRNMAMGKPIVRAILDGASEIALPAFVSTLCICIVFVPVAFITGSAKSLFIPLALAVVLAMLTSYFLSRTLVPTLVRYLLAKEVSSSHGVLRAGLFGAFDRGFHRLRAFYGRWLAFSLGHKRSVIGAFAAFTLGSFTLFPMVGRDFFPSVDAGLIKLHVRAAPGQRIEKTERDFVKVDAAIRKVIPPKEIDTIIDNIGTPVSGINLSLSEGALISSADGQVLVALKDRHGSTPEYERRLRRELHREFPSDTFFFLAPDIASQVLNFGVAAPLDVQIVGPTGQEARTYAVAEDLRDRIARLPGAADVHLAQVVGRPQLDVDVNRTMAAQLGLTIDDVSSDLLVSLASSGQVSPGWWLDPKHGVQYLVAVQTPQYEINSIDALDATPIARANGAPALLSNVATISRSTGPVNITHYDVRQTYDVQANVDGTDLGSLSDAVDRVLAQAKPKLPRGTTVRVKGQVESMRSSFRGLAYGLGFAVLLVYLLMVVNFQSWLDPFVILMALPGALSGIAWMLFLTHTTINVPSLMGSIMCVGVATANSILVVTFANDQRKLGLDAERAALASGMTRLRPVIMTALAMILGMLPMSLGLGEGGEQNAPLARAVIGGLLVATLSTLLFVPVMYGVLRKSESRHDAEWEAV